MARSISISRDEAELLADVLDVCYFERKTHNCGVGWDLSTNVRVLFGMTTDESHRREAWRGGVNGENLFVDNEREEVAARRGAVGIYKPTEQDKIWMDALNRINTEKNELEIKDSIIRQYVRNEFYLNRDVRSLKTKLWLSIIINIIQTCFLIKCLL